MESFLNGKIVLHIGGCLAILPTLDENSFDSCVTDPPYHLTSIVKRFGADNAKPCKSNLVRDPETLQPITGRQSTSQYGRLSTGFMGKQWDGGDVAFRPETWAEVYRVLKPGAHLLAFGGTRTYHRMACAIEDAGFEIRDCIQWLYGSGFPKSHDVSKGIDRAAGAERERYNRPAFGGTFSDDNGTTYGTALVNEPATDAARQWEGWGTALKPACEPIVLARKPLSEKTVAANVLRWGTGAINVDGCRVATDDDGKREHGGAIYEGVADGYKRPNKSSFTHKTDWEMPPQGRWPANVIHDGSDEVVAGFPESDATSGPFYRKQTLGVDSTVNIASRKDKLAGIGHGDSGSAARFFYQVKGDDRCEHNASNAAKCFLGCHRQNGDIAPLIAPTQDELKTAQSVKSAASLCNSCAIDIARVLVAPRQAQSAVSRQFRDIIGERNAQILSQCLALYVEGREGTDTILTIQNLKQLFGSVFHAIGTYTEASDCDDRTAPNESKRFWYTSKADQDDRIGSKHPTVKPLDLMQYLVRLVTPKGGTCLDMFAGSGTTGEAAFREGMRAVLVEREAEYQTDIRRRADLCTAGPDQRLYESAKAKQAGKPRDDGPLFSGEWDDMWSRPFDRPDLV